MTPVNDTSDNHGNNGKPLASGATAAEPAAIDKVGSSGESYRRSGANPEGGVNPACNSNPNTNFNADPNPQPSSESNSNSTLNIPSPPLSPYTRNGFDENDNIPILLFPRASKPLTSDLRYLDLYTSPKSNPSSNQLILSGAQKTGTVAELEDPKIENKDENSTAGIEAAAASETQEEEPRGLLGTVLQADNTTPPYSSDDSILQIDPYKQLNRPGFKKFQLNFLNEYQFKNLNSSSSSSSSSYNNTYTSTRASSRSAIRQAYNTIKSNTYNSNSDSELEKPRTRRLVRQNKYDLEFADDSDSLISRPSTPVKKRSSNHTTIASPKRQRTSTPISYNYDYKKIEDFCPPFDTLPPNNNKCLKTDWKGQSMDLSNDPLIAELHPAEVVLASILRLPCGVYLDSKRRIFQEKVKRMRHNLPFRRTDAQKSCKIDVNKASRLFAAFEKVGWFDEKHFKKFL